MRQAGVEAAFEPGLKTALGFWRVERDGRLLGAIRAKHSVGDWGEGAAKPWGPLVWCQEEAAGRCLLILFCFYFAPPQNSLEI